MDPCSYKQNSGTTYTYHVETPEGIVLKRHTDQLKNRYTDSDPTPGDDISEVDESNDFPVETHTNDPPQIPIAPPVRRSTRHRRPVDHGPYVDA